jgi:hypothetical protein
MTSGCVFAGLIKVSGLCIENTALAGAIQNVYSSALDQQRRAGRCTADTHAIAAAPKIPNLSASALLGGGFDGLKAPHNRLTMPAILREPDFPVVL